MERYGIEPIRQLSEDALCKSGLSFCDARVVVDTMLAADINGVSTHGIRMLPAYINKLSKNEFSTTRPEIIKQAPSFTIIDAKNTVGAISATFATQIAVEQAKNNGIHTVFSRNANTLGPGFYYAELIANNGMIGFVCCNAPAAMTAYNGLEAMLGTNPLAFAMPTKSYGNIVMDMASSVVAKSRFATAKAKGEKLENGWAIDKQGNPTTDPDEAIQGFVLPMAGFKGYGIAMMIDIMAGFMSGAGFLNRVGKFYSADGRCMNVGHFITAFNPDVLFDGDFLIEADKYVATIRNSKVKENGTIILPGDDRKIMKKESFEKGIPLSPDVVDKLENIFGKKLK